MSDTVETKKGGVKETIANPFPGLRPFSIEESHLFFGREGQSDEVLLKLSKNRFIGVIGPSGSGKSSFIYCGVLPILYGGFLTDTGPNWDVVVTRPGSSPIENLAHAVLEKDPNYQNSEEDEQKIKKKITTTLLKSSSLGLVEAVLQTKRASKNNYLILIDQFEELFRFKDSRDNEDSLNETLAFVNLLMEAVNYSEVPIYVAITMRSDFIGECAQFPDLTKKINDSHYLIPQLTREQKRKAITGPVQVGGGEIAPRLVQQLLNDLGDNPDQLPILQHALMRTWDYWSKYREGEEAMDLKHYDAIGRMEEALSMHANEAYDELTDEQKEICETMFKAITEKRGENFGIRRPTKVSEIAAIADVSPEEVIEIVEKFRQPGRSLLTPPYPKPITEKSVIDISHESLMRIWVRLKNWVDDEAEAVQMYLRLAEAATMYQVGKGGLWRPPDLQLALNWQQKHKPTLVWGQRYHPAFERTMVFLEYSKKEYETEQRIKELQAKRALKRARITALVMGAATVVSLMFLLFAFAQKVEADKQRDLAVEQQQIAEEQRAAALAAKEEADEQRALAEENAEEAERQRQEAETQRDLAVQAQLLADQRRIEAEEQRARAEQQEALAKKNEQIAKENEAEATKQRDIATTERERAEQLRYIAQAKAMGIKASQLIPDNNLKGLLAQQAYIFNDTHDGYAYDPDIYDGLYYAIKELDSEHNLVEELEGHEGEVRALASSLTGDHIFSAGNKGKILQWDIKSGTRVADTLDKNPQTTIRTLAATNDGKWMAAGGRNVASGAFLEVFNIDDKSAEPQIVSGLEGQIIDLEFIPTNDHLVILEASKTIHIWDFNSLETIYNSNVNIHDVAVSPDGKYIAGALVNGKVLLWDRTNNYEVTEHYQNNVPMWSVRFSNGNDFFAGGAENGWVYIWTINNGEISKTVFKQLTDHNAAVRDIRFSENGQFMGTASMDKTVRLWNLQDLDEQPIVLKDHPDWVWAIAFTPDSDHIMAGTQEQIIKAWPTHLEDMTNEICSLIDRNMTLEEWATYVGEDIVYEQTCSQYPPGDEAVVGKTYEEIKGN